MGRRFCNVQGRASLVLRKRRPMLDLLFRAEKPFLICSALAVAALAGWSSFAYSASSSGQQAKALMAERDAALANYQQLQASAGKLSEVEASSARRASNTAGSCRVGLTREARLGWRSSSSPR